MRRLRPEIYSDTEGRTDYQLDATLLEYHLNTLTNRNQTQAFEIFCRKLCERAICPNLRPQTGPDGGGDSKADTETLPVADEITDLYYVGQANSGRERWAFAFSAKQTWKQKVRDDVHGLIDTGRHYDRIICVGVAETEKVERIILSLKARDLAIVIVSHNLDQVFRLADRICGLRRGRQISVATREPSLATKSCR